MTQLFWASLNPSDIDRMIDTLVGRVDQTHANLIRDEFYRFTIVKFEIRNAEFVEEGGDLVEYEGTVEIEFLNALLDLLYMKAKLRSSSWWRRFFIQTKLEENEAVTKKCEQDSEIGEWMVRDVLNSHINVSSIWRDFLCRSPEEQLLYGRENFG
ncbi:hypothetical protein LguiB_022075 [Lonicera macranthoides]